MKKKIVLLLALVIAVSIPFLSLAEDIDISGLSFDELIDLQKKINAAIMQTDGWQEVTIPKGIYKIGLDLPEGDWSLRAAQSSSYIRLGKKLEEGKIEELLDFGTIKGDEKVKKTLVDGTYFEVVSGEVIFEPYVPAFSFK